MQYQFNFQNISKSIPKNITLERILQEIEVQRNLDFIEKVQRPSNKTIRLAKELAKQHAPMMLDHNDTVRSIMNRSDISDTKIEKVKSFKKILFRTIIIDVKPMQDRYIIKTKKVRIR